MTIIGLAIQNLKIKYSASVFACVGSPWSLLAKVFKVSFALHYISLRYLCLIKKLQNFSV